MIVNKYFGKPSIGNILSIFVKNSVNLYFRINNWYLSIYKSIILKVLTIVIEHLGKNVEKLRKNKTKS